MGYIYYNISIVMGITVIHRMIPLELLIFVVNRRSIDRELHL